MSKKQKTIQYLNGRAWYRLIKVIYLGFFIIALLIAIGGSYGANYPHYSSYLNKYYGSWEEVFGYAFLWSIIVILVFEGIRRAFYYVVCGTIKPIKKEVKKVTTEAQQFCTQCGAGNNSNSNYCEKCGNKF
jgi:ribosomal protein L40E